MASSAHRIRGKWLWRWSHSRPACSASTKAARVQTAIHWWRTSRPLNRCVTDGGSRATASRPSTSPPTLFWWQLCAARLCSTATISSATSTSWDRSTFWVSTGDFPFISRVPWTSRSVRGKQNFSLFSSHFHVKNLSSLGWCHWLMHSAFHRKVENKHFFDD